MAAGRETNGELVQVFTPTGSTDNPSLTHDVTGMSYWRPHIATTYSYDVPDWGAASPVSLGEAIGVPEGAKTLTLTNSQDITYRKE